MGLLDIKFKPSYLNEEFNLSDVISNSDLFYIDGVDVPIITKPGIKKLRDKFKIVVSDIDVKLCGASYNDAFVSVTVKLSVPEIDFQFAYDGEASQANLEGEISRNYPQALAVKRAISRGVLDLLAIPAMSEIESPDFQRKRPINIEDIPAKIIEKIGEEHTKKVLLGFIRKICDEEKIEKVKGILRRQNDLHENDPINISDISLESVLSLITADV